MTAGPEAMKSDSSREKRSEDPENALIPFTEGYRKAKRNSLIWSSLVILSAFGVTNGSAQVPLYPTGLVYPQFLTVALSLCVSVFMLLSYVRLEFIVKMKSSEFFFDQGDKELADAFSSLVKEVKEKEEKIKEISLEITGLNSATTKVASEIFHLVTKDLQKLQECEFYAGSMVSDADRIVKNFHKIREVDEESLPFLLEEIQAEFNSIEYASKEATKISQNFRSDVESRGFAADPKLREMVSKWKAEERNIEEYVKAFINEMESVVNASNRINSYHKSISLGEKRWHFWLDRFPVYTLFLLSLVCAAAWLVFRQSPLVELKLATIPVTKAQDHPAN